jgi:hypothetical protein
MECQFKKLPKNLLEKTLYEFAAEYPFMPLKQMSDLSQISKNHYALFQPALKDAKAALPLLLAVVQSDVEALQSLVVANPNDFFKKGQVTDPSGKTFYHVSPFQLIVFLCDIGMLRQILPLIPLQLRPHCVIQYASIDCGGADLVKMDRNPEELDFSEIKQFKASYSTGDVTFPLLENLDGIIYYLNKGTPQLYLANRIMETVIPLGFNPEDAPALKKLYDCFTNMENNSSRRSSNDEHALIAHLINHKLSRKGIQYKHQGILYCDSRLDFNKFINAYRTCIRLYQGPHWDWDKANYAWCNGVGGEQRQILWILHHLCERNHSLSPPNFTVSRSQRRFELNKLLSDDASVFCDGLLATGLGLSYAVYLGAAWNYAPWGQIHKVPDDFIALNSLIGNAKALIIEFNQYIELTDERSSFLPQAQSPLL